MSLFGKYGYHAEHEEQSHSLISKAVGLAFFAGGAAVALSAARPYISKGLGSVAGWVAKDLASNTSGWFGRVGQAAEILSSELQVFKGLSSVESGILSTAQHATRIETIVQGMEDSLLGPGKKFEDVSRSRLISELQNVGKAAGTEGNAFDEAHRAFYNSETQTRINNILADYDQGFLGSKAYKQRMNSVLKRATKSKVNAQQVFQLDETSVEELTRVIQHSVHQQREFARGAEKLVDTSKFTKIKFKDILDSPRNDVTRNLVDEYLQKIGRYTSHGKIRPVDALIQEVTGPLSHLLDSNKAFEDKFKGLLADLGDSLTGLVIDKKSSSVFSMAHGRNTVGLAVDRALNELQFPLVPFMFNIKAKSLFSFAKTDAKIIKNLGNISLEGNLARFVHSQRVMLNQFSPHTEGVMIGNRILAMTPSEKGVTLNTIKKLDNEQIIDAGFEAIKMNSNSNLKRVAATRSLSIEDRLDDLKTSLEEKGILGTITEKQRGAYSDIEKALYNRHESLLEYAYDKDYGYIVLPREDTGKIARLNRMVRQKLYKNGIGIGAEKLHPRQLLQLIKSNFQDILTTGDRVDSFGAENLQAGLYHILKEASDSRVDLTKTIKQLVEMYDSGSLKVDIADSYKDHLLDLARNIDSPDKILDALNHYRDSGTIFTKFTDLSKEATTEFYQAITRIHEEGMKNLFEIGVSEPHIITGFLGEKNPSALIQKLQRGILSEFVEGSGKATVNELLESEGVTLGLINLHKALNLSSDATEEIVTNARNLLKNSALVKALRKENMSDLSIRNLVNSLVRVESGQYKIERGLLADLGNTLGGTEFWSGLGIDKTSKSLILRNLSKGFFNIEEFSGQTGFGSVKTIKELDSFEVDKALKDRFSLGRGWHPRDPIITPAQESKYLILPNSRKGVMEILNMDKREFGLELKNQILRGFGIGDFLKQMYDPNKEFTKSGLAATILLQMPQNIGQKIGLGLPEEDLVTALRSSLGFYGKRVVPLVGAYLGYKEINKLLHAANVEGVDDFAANTLGNARLTLATAGDISGITSILKNAVSSLPGLDMYLHPRTEEETRDYLLYGEEEVRKGRGWIIGSKSALTGGKVDFVRPNFYRRWKSHWTELDYDEVWQTGKLVGSEGGSAGTGIGGFIGTGVGVGGGRGGTYGGIAVPGASEGNGGVITPGDAIAGAAQTARRQMGLYGGIAQMIPGYPKQMRDQVQDPEVWDSPSRLLSMGKYGEGSFLFGEFFRRFIPTYQQDYDAPSPILNQMPNWLPKKFKTGNPYLRTPGIGELNLPGPGFEATHPWVAPLKVRGSSIGLSVNELVEKMVDPVGYPEDDEGGYLEFGSRAHLLIQRHLRQLGVLLGSEVAVYNKEQNISGTIDAIVRGTSGPEVVEIKTQGSKDFNEGVVPGKYKDQLNFYLGTLGIRKGYLAFVNRDDPSQVRIDPMLFDQDRYQAALTRVEEARNIVKSKVDAGEISPFESYDLLARIEILARVAPESEEFARVSSYAEKSGGFNEFERQRYRQAIEVANTLNEDFNLYPYRYNVPTELTNVQIQSINDDGSITTDHGTFTLAGVKIDSEAFAYEDPQDVFSKFGVRIGSVLPITLIKGMSTNEALEDTVTPAIFGPVNRAMMHSDYGEPDLQARDPLSVKAVHGDSLFRDLFEQAAHMDSMLNNKFFRVRSPLEQFKRGEVYGSDNSNWQHLYSNYIKPTINSLISKNPLTAGIQGGIIASMFVQSQEAKLRLGIIGAIAFAGLSALREGRDAVSKEPWTPTEYRKKAELDEYYDILEYLKETSLEETAKQAAKGVEHTNIEEILRTGDTPPGLGPYSLVAIAAAKKANRTMFGFDVETGTLEEAIAAIPRRHRQIAEQIILTGSPKEKEEFYSLLPDSERRVLGKFLGVKEEKLPERANLNEYFKQHFLPDTEWEGWDRSVRLADIEERAEDLENITLAQPNRLTIEKARARTNGIDVPRMDSPTIINIKKAINDLIHNNNLNNLAVQYSVSNAQETSVNLNFDLAENRTNEVMHEVRNHIRRS